MPNSMDSRRMLRTVLVEQVDLQKRLRYPLNSVYYAANKNRGEPFVQDWEFSSVDWERGTFQSCSLSQDHRILPHHSKNSPFHVVP